MTSASPVGAASAWVIAAVRSAPTRARASATLRRRTPVIRTGTVSTNMPTGRSSSVVNRPETGTDNTKSSESEYSASTAESATHSIVLSVVP